MAEIDTFYSIYGALDRGNWRHESRGLNVGDVVKYPRGSRLYVVVTVDQFGHYGLRALSGGPKGSGPSAVKPNEISKVNEPVVFRGKKAEWLAREARKYVALHHSWKDQPKSTAPDTKHWRVEGDSA